ncbi:hypothetical protein AAG906_005353 [Vitis piasezkii]
MLVESPYSHDSSIFGIERIGAWHYLLGIWAFVSRHFIHLFTPGLRYGPSRKTTLSTGCQRVSVLRDIEGDILPFHSTACLKTPLLDALTYSYWGIPHPCMLALALTHVRSKVLLRVDSESNSRYSLTQRMYFRVFIGIFELQIFDPSCLGFSGIVPGFDPFCFGFFGIVPGFDPSCSGFFIVPDSISFVLGSPTSCPDSIPLVSGSPKIVPRFDPSCFGFFGIASGFDPSCFGFSGIAAGFDPFCFMFSSIVSGFDPFCFGFSDIMPGFDPVGLGSLEDSEARPLLKVGWQVAVKAQSWSLAQEPLSVLFGGLREMGSWLLPKVRVGLGFRRRSLGILLKMVLWFGSISHLRRVFVEQMTSVKWNLAI